MATFFSLQNAHRSLCIELLTASCSHSAARTDDFRHRNPWWIDSLGCHIVRPGAWRAELQHNSRALEEKDAGAVVRGRTNRGGRTLRDCAVNACSESTSTRGVSIANYVNFMSLTVACDTSREQVWLCKKLKRHIRFPSWSMLRHRRASNLYLYSIYI